MTPDRKAPAERSAASKKAAGNAMNPQTAGFQASRRAQASWT